MAPAAVRRVLSLLSVAVLVAGLAACGDDDENADAGDSGDTTEETTGSTDGTSGSDDPFCQARDDLGAALGALADPTDDVDVEEAVDQIDTAFGELRDAAGDELGDEVDALEDAIGSLDDAVTDSEGDPVSERLETLGGSISDVGSALDDLASAAAQGC